MNRAQAKVRLAELQTAPGSNDQEIAHIEADKVLCQLLCELGYDDVVVEWMRIEKTFG